MGSSITNRDREAITKQLIERAMREKRLAHKQAGHKLFDECCDAIVGEHKAAIEALPPGFMPERIKLTFPYTFGGIHLGYSNNDLHGAFSRRMPPSVVIDASEIDDDDLVGEDAPTHTVLLPNHMRRKCLAWFKKGLELNEDEEALGNDIKGMLYGTRSWKKLFEIWPELAELKLAAAPPEAATGSHLSVNLPELNKKLRLPPNDEKET